MTTQDTPTPEIKLLPCPFCSGTDLKLFGESAPEWWVSCQSCFASGRTSASRTKAADAWNRRAAIAHDRQQRGEPVAWHTEDHLIDKSATTYDPAVAKRWLAKGWPVSPLFQAPQPTEPVTVPSDADILHIWDSFVSEPNDKYPLTDADKIGFANAILARYGVAQPATPVKQPILPDLKNFPSGQPAQPAESVEPWYGHKYQQFPGGVWKCADGCGPDLYEHTPVAAQPSVPNGLIAALRNQRQIDRDGSEVAVSRQAVDEAADLLDKLATPPAAAQAQQGLLQMLKNPAVVHHSMLVGKIAKITMMTCAHTHGEDMVRRWRAFEDYERGQAQQDDRSDHCRINGCSHKNAGEPVWEAQQGADTEGANTGHGHVFPRPDNVKMRCGGPGICPECSRDAARAQQGGQS